MPMALSGICWNYILIRCASSILWLCFCHSIAHFVFFFLEISNQNEQLTITWIKRLEFYFQNLAKEILEWFQIFVKNAKSIFASYTCIFCSFPELTISLTDLAIIGKKRNSIKLTLINQGFSSPGNNFFSFFFLTVPQTLCRAYVSQIDGFCDFLGGNLAHYTDS